VDLKHFTFFDYENTFLITVYKILIFVSPSQIHVIRQKIDIIKLNNAFKIR